MTESERINFLIDAVANGNSIEFGKRLGLVKSTVAKLRSDKYPNSLNGYVSRIIEAYPSVNRMWLTTGEGYPGDLTVDLMKARYEDKLRRADRVIDHLTKRIEELESQLSDVKNPGAK